MNNLLKKNGFLPYTEIDNKRKAIAIPTNRYDVIIEVWYNKHTRDWVAMPIHRTRFHQMGDSEYCGSLEWAIESAKFMAANLEDRKFRFLYQ